MAARVPDDEAPQAFPPPPSGAVPEVQLVPMRRRHLRSVLRIEAQVYPRPWTLSLFMSELALRSTRAYHVAKAKGIVVGYSGLMFSGADAHVTTIAVEPAWHRYKIGTRLMLNMAWLARSRGARNFTLEVRVTNRIAQALYYRFGFQPAGIRKNYYAETQEDALVMWVEDIDTDGYAHRLDAIEAALGPSTPAIETDLESGPASEERW